MNTHDFLTQQLASTGWAPVDTKLAALLDPDQERNWRDYAAYNLTPDVLPRQFKNTTVVTAEVAGFGRVLVLTRSLTLLAERMEFIIGAPVQILAESPNDSRQPFVPATPVPAPPAKPIDPLEKVRALAAQTPPAHECTLRREILAARTELAARGESVPEPVATP